MTEPPKRRRLYPSRTDETVVGKSSPDARARHPDDGPAAIAPGRSLGAPGGAGQGARYPLAPSDDAGVPGKSPVEGDALVLPEGALIAMRRSGGLLFNSRVIVVYPDGRLATSAIGGGRSSRADARSALPAAHLARLRHVLGDIDFARLRDTPVGHPRPDAYAYEIAVRVGRAPVSLEAFEGSVPASLAPLIALLSGLVRDGG